MNYRHLLVSLILGFTSLRVLGQDTSALSLTQLWEIAVNNYPGVQAFEANLRQAGYEEKLLRYKHLPQLQLQIQNTLGSQQVAGGAFFPLPGIYTIGGNGDLSGQATNMFGSVVMDWEFFRFGQKKKLMEVAGIATQQAAYRLETEKLAIQTQLSKSYFRYLFNQKMHKWAKRSTNRLRFLFDAVKSMADAGLASGADSLLVKATLKQSQVLLNNWEGYERSSMIDMATWINKPPGQFSIEDSLFFTTVKIPASEDGGIHPMVALKMEQVNYSRKMKALTGLSTLPAFSLLAGIQVRGNAPVQDEFYSSWRNSYDHPTGNYLIGLGLTWNLSKLFEAGPEKEKFKEETYRRKAEAETVSLELQRQEGMAAQQLRRDLQQIRDAEQAYTAARSAYRLFVSRYESGLIPVTDLLQIQTVVETAEKARIESYYQYWVQQVELAAARADFSLLQKASDEF